MKKIQTMVPVVLFLLAASVRAHAQISGCDDSPENPTVVLGLIVGAAGIACVQVRKYLRAHKDSGDKG